MTDEEFTAEEVRYVQERRAALAKAAKSGAYPMRTIAAASLLAQTSAEVDGLSPRFYAADREWRYDTQQGLRAAAHGREDSAAVLTVMHEVLRNQQNIKRALWVVFFMLLAVLSKL